MLPSPRRRRCDTEASLLLAQALHCLLDFLSWPRCITANTSRTFSCRPPPRPTLPPPPLLRRRRLTRPRMLPSPRRRRFVALALLVQSCLDAFVCCFHSHTCTPTLSFFPCFPRVCSPPHFHVSLSPSLTTVPDCESISRARSQAAPAPDAAAPAPADAPKAADAPADAPKPKKKKVLSLSTLVPVLVIQLLGAPFLACCNSQTPHFLVYRLPPRPTLPLPSLLRRRRLTRPRMLPSPRRRRCHAIAIFVQSSLVALVCCFLSHTCTPTLSFFPCVPRVRSPPHSHLRLPRPSCQPCSTTHQ
jgi:hypothetical protein